MLTYPGDPRGNPPPHVALSSFSTPAEPFTADGPHPPGPTLPNPSFAVSAAPSLNASGGWGEPSLMEAHAGFMAPDAASAASLGYTGEVFDSAPYGIYSGYHFGNFVDPHPLRSESSELMSEKRPGTCGESSHALSNGFGLSGHCQQQNALASKLFDGIGTECVGCYHPRPVPNQDPSGSATSLISGAPAVPVNSLASESVLGNVSSQAAQAEKNALDQILTKEGDDCLRNSCQMSCLRNNFSVAIREHSVSENIDSEFNTYFSQALPKLPEDKMLDDSEASEVSIYKKLWIEAEASVCKLKYELQVARMKLATKKGHNNTETVPTNPSEGDKAFSLYVSGGRQHSHAKESTTYAVAHGPGAQSSGPAPPPPASDILSPRSIIATKKSIVNGVDVKRLAPLEVLKSRIDNVNSLSENKCEEQKKASKESHAAEDGVLVELSILKSCTDNITSLSLESSKHQLDTSTNPTDEVDETVDEMFARLKVLESRIDTLSSLGENKYEEQQRESEGSSAVDDAVLARLRLLKSRADNITSMRLDSSKQQRDAGTNTSGEIDAAVAEVCTRFEVLERNLSSLGDNNCEEQQKESMASSSVGDGVLERLQNLKSRADNMNSLVLQSSKQQLNASMDITDEVDDVVMARIRILKSHPDLEASLVGGDVESVKEDTCAVGPQVSSRQPPSSPATALKKTTLPSAIEPLELTGETLATLISPSVEVMPLCTLKDAPSVLEKDHSGLADDALPPALLLCVPQEAGGLAQKIPKVKRLPHGSTPRGFRLPPTIKIKRPISEQGACSILLRKLGMVKGDEVDEEAINRCVKILEASFPKSLIQAIFCTSDMVKGTPGELWGISASDVVF